MQQSWKLPSQETACCTGLGTLKSQNDGESQKIIQDHKNIQPQKFGAIIIISFLVDTDSEMLTQY